MIIAASRVPWLRELAVIKDMPEDRLLDVIRAAVTEACRYEIRSTDGGLLYATCGCPEPPLRPGQLFLRANYRDLVALCSITHREAMVRRAVRVLYREHQRRALEARFRAAGYRHPAEDAARAVELLVS